MKLVHSLEYLVFALELLAKLLDRISDLESEFEIIEPNEDD